MANIIKYFLLGVLTGLIILGMSKFYLDFKNNYVSKEELKQILADQNNFFNQVNPNYKKIEPRSNSITRAVQKVNKAVVGINVVKLKKQYIRSPFSDDPIFRQFFPPRYVNKKIPSVGSGCIYSPDGYIITNEHVIHNAYEEGIIVTTTEGKEYKAKIIGADQISDIAILKIDVKDHAFIKIGDSEDIIIGEWVIALGNPYGLFEYSNQPLITVGVVSGLNINFGKSRDGLHFYESMIQTDASINPGNSGGPLVNSEGEIIGVNTMIYSSDSGGSIGIGFAVPINKVLKIKNILMENGYVNRNINWGFQLSNLNTDKKDVAGVSVVNVLENSPAFKAGFKKGDIIVGVENLKINNFADIKNALLEAKDYKVNDLVDFYIYRDKDYKKIKMQLEAY